MIQKPKSYRNRTFDLLSAGDAYTVVGVRDGRPVCGELSYSDAVRVRETLNEAAVGGPKSLARALGAVDD